MSAEPIPILVEPNPKLAGQGRYCVGPRPHWPNVIELVGPNPFLAERRPTSAELDPILVEVSRRLAEAIPILAERYPELAEPEPNLKLAEPNPNNAERNAACNAGLDRTVLFSSVPATKGRSRTQGDLSVL